MRTRTYIMLVVAGLWACSGPEPGTSPGGLPIFSLGPTPSLEIGVLEGDTSYLFQSIVSVLPLASGNLLLADAGASQIAIHDPGGTFVRRWGGRGEGPGEFRNLARVYAMGPDSVMALDGWTDRLSVFDTAGNFARQIPVADISADTLFRMDVWLYGRFWVDGALGDDSKAAVRRVLDMLPPPRTGPGYRLVRVASNGDLWIREPRIEDGGTRTWTIVASEGRPKALVSVPVRFDPQTIDGSRVYGRWLGESDVHFARVYDLTPTGTVPAPAWLSSGDALSAEAPEQEAFMDEIRTTFRAMARAQEIHYATQMTYTARLDSLEWEPSPDVVVDVVNAGPRGWVAVFTHPALDRICGLGYGFTVPPGWAPGGVLCGPVAAAQESETP